MNRFCVIAGMLFATVVAAKMLVLPARAQAPAPPIPLPGPNGPSADPIDLFKEIYPVFSHPRCVNCHGVVETSPNNIRELTGRGHGGGVVSLKKDDECSDCHNVPDILVTAWRFTAPPHMSFVGKDLEQMCALQSQEVDAFDGAVGSHSAAVDGSYMHHLVNDPLIEAGFAGIAGGKIYPPKPPPLSKGEFLAAAQKWLDAGAGCGRLEGTITQTEKFEDRYAGPAIAGMPGTMTYFVTGSRTVTINRYSDGTVSATVSMGGYNKTTNAYSLDGCDVRMSNGTNWQGTTSNPVKVNRLDVTRNGGAYEIAFTLAAEKTQATDTGTMTATCPMPETNDVHVAPELTWSPWKFTIRCPANFTPDGENTIDCDTNTSTNPPTLSGRMVRIVRGPSDAHERQSWLNLSPIGTGRPDGNGSIAVRVETTWNLRAIR